LDSGKKKKEDLTGRRIRSRIGKGGSPGLEGWGRLRR